MIADGGDHDSDPFEAARRLLRHHYGFRAFRNPQAAVIRAVLAGRDVLAVLPTGSGKSVCYQVPALLAPGLTIVVTPLVSLMEDQVARAVERRIPAAALHAGRSAAEVRRIRRRLARGALKLLYASPEKLEGETMRRFLGGCLVSRIAVDEAHCVSEWGHDFRPSYRRIAAFRRSAGHPPCIALTATATPATQRDVSANLELRRPVSLVWPVDRPNLRWAVQCASGEAHAARELIDAARRTPGAMIVYTRTRRAAVRMAEALRRYGVGAAAYHAGMSPAARQATQDAFLGGRLRAVCATTAFGMGIDHPSVRLVGHLGAPESLEAYVQEAGRAGRDGEPARCLLIARADDDAFHRARQRRAWPSVRSARRVWRSLPRAEPVSRPRLRHRLRRWDAAEVRDILACLERHGAVRRIGQRWVRGPDALWIGAASALVRGRERARMRRAAMHAYVRSPGCRRHAIARYFGDGVPTCGGCDRCDDN